MAPTTPEDVNCRATYHFQVDIQTPNAAGTLATPTLGAVTGIKLRLVAVQGGAAIDPTLDDLATSELAGRAGRFAKTIDPVGLGLVLAAVGHRGIFYGEWYKTGSATREYTLYRALDGRLNA